MKTCRSCKNKVKPKRSIKDKLLMPLAIFLIGGFFLSFGSQLFVLMWLIISILWVVGAKKKCPKCGENFKEYTGGKGVEEGNASEEYIRGRI